MKKLNDLIKTKYYAVYENDNCIGVYIDNDDYDNNNSNSNYKNYKYIEKECYDFYDDGNFDTAESTEMVVLNISINEESQEISFMNSVGFALCVLHLHFKENNINYKINNIYEYQYPYNNSFGEYKKYEHNELVNDLLLLLNDNNICIISSLINHILYFNLKTIEDLEEWEDGATHYAVSNENKEISIESKKEFIDICIFDILTLKGMRNHHIIENNVKSSISRKELIKNITIRELLENYDITYLYSFYKLLFEEEVVDPTEFIK